MCADTVVRFRDPFGGSGYSQHLRQQRQEHHYNDRTTPTWHSAYRHQTNRARTPPRAMNGIAHSTKQAPFAREHAHPCGDYMSSQQSQRATAAPAQYLPQMRTGSEYPRAAGTHVHTGNISPIRTAPQSVVETHTSSESRRNSQQNNSSIAPSFQIPRSINDSGGSLSELAAQMTCLFWFESSEVLQQIEDSPIPLQSPKQLVADARPTTGFRKWVTTILSTTCVAQNVVLLALLFVHRLKKLNPTVRGKPGSEYRLLTVALMLGNKFLDDNTYTNKTWAEVSGINVAEVHIMEVEFLSNMKYCLFTSADDWSKWQSLLGKFAAFFERASRPQPLSLPAPILPPASSLHLPMSLPSPPASNQASPPYLADLLQNAPFNPSGVNSLTPAPSPMVMQANANMQFPTSRKRSRDDGPSEPAAKRIATGHQHYQASQPYGNPAGQTSTGQQVPRLTLPSISMPPSMASSSAAHAQTLLQGQQLPPLAIPGRAMAMVYPSSNSHTAIPPSSSQPPSQYHSRQQSPYPVSANVSPQSAIPLPAAPAFSRQTQQLSPTHFYLQQRNSPYRPVHHVSTLINPPTSTSALHKQRPHSVDHDQMSYQPLGKPFQARQNGRLPYVAQNIWLDPHGDTGPQAMTPVHQWPSFAAAAAVAAQRQQHQILQRG